MSRQGQHHADSQENRVVVTGMGIVTAIGQHVDAFWESLLRGQSGIRSLEHLRLPFSKSRIGGQIGDFPAPFPALVEEGWDDRGLKLALLALSQVMQADEARPEAYPSDRTGVAMGTCSGGIYSGQRWLEKYWEHQPGDPKHARMYDYHFAAEVISGLLRAGGPVCTISTACASSNNAIGLASDFIRSGKADCMYVGGFDALLETVYSGFCSVSALDERPCRPYSADRGGLSLGEGAAFLVLERYDTAAARGASVYAEVLGYGLSLDGYHPTAPHPEGAGAARAMNKALKYSGLQPADIDYINGHGTGTLLNDSSETQAVLSVLGDSAYSTPLSSTKGATGHTLGASGVVEGIATIQAIRHGVIPPTVHWQTRDPALPLDYVPNEPRTAAVRNALSNSFAFGGNNAVVAFGAPEPGRKPGEHGNHSIVITGIGMVTTEGLGLEPFLAAMERGALIHSEVRQSRNGNRYLRIQDADLERIGRQFDKKTLRRIDRSSLIGLYAVQRALEHAGIVLAEERSEAIGLVSSHAFAVYEQFAEMFKPAVDPEYRLRPSVFPNSVYNAAVGTIASYFGIHGPGSTLNGGAASSALGLVHAIELMRKGDCEIMVCLGSDIYCDESIDALADAGLLPGGAAHPLGRSSDGPLSAEGAVALLLETEEHARKRQAPILGLLAEYSLKSNASLPSAASVPGDGLFRAMKELTESRRVYPDAVWTASGSPPGDLLEAEALQRLAQGRTLPMMASARSVMGETWGASALLNMAAGILSQSRHRIPGLEVQDPALRLMPRLEPAIGTQSSILVNALNGGGTCASFLLQFPPDRSYS